MGALARPSPDPRDDERGDELRRSRLKVTHLQFTAARELDAQSGLVGWLAFEVGELAIDSVTLRRTERGEFQLSYPQRHDGHGRPHTIVRATSGAARRAIHEQVLAELRRQGAIP